MDLPKAIQLLQDRPEFQLVEKAMIDYRDTHIADLSNMQNAENPQLLAYLAGGISAMNVILMQIDECKQTDTE